MKFLRKYKMFEMKSSIVDDLKDICLDLTDFGLCKVSISEPIFYYDFFPDGLSNIYI